MNDMIKPCLASLSQESISKGVYVPDSDSFCLMDAIEKDFMFISSQNPRIVMDFGSGSGVLSSHFRLIMQDARFKSQCILPRLQYMYCVDINQCATKTTYETLKLNSIPQNQLFPYEVLSGDLSNSFLLSKFRNMVDIVLWNPPYVPSCIQETSLNYKGSGSMCDLACAGGKDGMSVVQQIIPIAIEALSQNGCIYLLLIEQNNPQAVIESLCRSYPVTATIILQRFSGERYTIIRLQKHAKQITR